MAVLANMLDTLRPSNTIETFNLTIGLFTR